MVRRYGEKLIRVFFGDEDATCRRCGNTGRPFCAQLDTSDQPHHASAFCSHCADLYGPHLIKYLPKPKNEGKRQSLSPGTRWTILERDGWRCAYCRRRKDQLEPGEYLHVDHVIPVSQGGTDDQANLVCACSACNLGKAARQLES